MKNPKIAQESAESESASSTSGAAPFSDGPHEVDVRQQRGQRIAEIVRE